MLLETVPIVIQGIEADGQTVRSFSKLRSKGWKRCPNTKRELHQKPWYWKILNQGQVQRVERLHLQASSVTRAGVLDRTWKPTWEQVLVQHHISGMARVGAVHRNVVKTGDSSNAFTYALVLPRRCSSCRSCFLTEERERSIRNLLIYNAI